MENNTIILPIRISRLHMSDLETAYLNCKNEKIRAQFEALKKYPGLCIIDNPEPGEFTHDLSYIFMYPDEIKSIGKQND